MNYCLFRKDLVLGVVLLFLGTVIIPSINGSLGKKIFDNPDWICDDWKFYIIEDKDIESDF
jgi:hypothetical protein